MNNALKSPEELLKIIKDNAAKEGNYISKDDAFVADLANGLFMNLQRYGYASCPCRFSTGIYEKDEDILCPCEYMKSDVEKYGSCFCCLYVSKEIYDGKKSASSIPESRPPSKIFALVDEKKAEKDSSVPVWRCLVCGYMHRGDNPPDKCPKCGAPKEMFERATDNNENDVTQYRCTVCGYIHKGENPPDKCPKCSAPKEMFVKI